MKIKTFGRIKMKIAYVVPVFPSLSETFILSQITGLIDLGFDVDIFSLNKGDQSKIHEDVLKYDLFKKVEYFRASTLEILLRKNRYDIIHCHFGPIGKMVAMLKRRRIIDSRIIVTFHGYDLSRYIKDHGEDIYNDVFLYADLCLPISNYWRNRLIELGCPEWKIAVHHMGIDLLKYKFITRKPKENFKVNILTIARLVEKKGVNFGIEAVNQLINLGYRVNYFIIGEGPQYNSLKEEITRKSIGDYVKLLGGKTQEEIHSILADSDILLAPSVTGSDGDMEGIPVAIMEAMATGIPIVSTYHSGIPELVESGENGYLVEEKDVHGLVEKLACLIESPMLREKFGSQGRNKIEREFYIKNLNQKLVAYMNKLMNYQPSHLVTENKEQELFGNTHNSGKVYLYDTDKLLALIKRNREIYIFGASSFGKTVYEELKQFNLMVNGFVDNNSLQWGRELEGLPVISPDQLALNNFVIIASAWYKEISNQLEQLGFQKEKDFITIIN